MSYIFIVLKSFNIVIYYCRSISVALSYIIVILYNLSLPYIIVVLYNFLCHILLSSYISWHCHILSLSYICHRHILSLSYIICHCHIFSFSDIICHCHILLLSNIICHCHKLSLSPIHFFVIYYLTKTEKSKKRKSRLSVHYTSTIFHIFILPRLICDFFRQNDWKYQR